MWMLKSDNQFNLVMSNTQSNITYINTDLLALWSWDEATFLAQTEGSAIRRIGHDRWLRNLATAMGNALADGRTSAKRRESFHNALNDRIDHKNVVVRAHIRWALAQKP